MKRFISVLGLALGMSISSYATLINTSGGPTTGSNLDSAGVGVTFDEVAYPLGAFTSIPFSFTNGSGSFTGTIQWLGSCSTAPNNCGSVVSFDGSGNTVGDKSLGNERISNYNFTGSPLNISSYSNTLRITFTSGNVGEFGLLLRNNDSRVSGGGAADASLNYMVVNFVQGGNSGNQNLPLQNSTSTNFFGWTANPGQQIASVDFVINGYDLGQSLALDILTFDDLRAFANTAGTTTGGGGGEIPEPSTYALIGAGLAALAYARRRR